MSHKKGFKLTYGVFSYTCSDFSSARSLYKQQRLIVVYTFNLKRIPNQLDTVFTNTIWTEWIPNEQSQVLLIFYVHLYYMS